MKILFILHSTLMSGAAISVLNLLRGMREQTSVYVIIPNFDDNFEDILTKLNIPYRVTSVYLSKNPHINRDNFIKKVYTLLRFPFSFFKLYIKKKVSEVKLLKIVRELKPDIIHTNTGAVHEGFKCAQKVGIPHVWHIREYQDKDFGWTPFPCMSSFEKKLKQSFVVTITDDLQKYFGLSKLPTVRTIYNGILHKNEIAMQWPKENYFMCASRITPDKGHDDVVRAFAEFYKTHHDFQLYILGFGHDYYIKQLKELAEDLGCADAIKWLGFQKDTVSFMKKARGLVVASHSEGFGRMTAEACFSGCVVIGRNSAGTKEILNNTGGYLFDNNNELLKYMNIVADLNESDYMLLAKTAQDRAVIDYSIEANVDGVLLLYKQILNK